MAIDLRCRKSLFGSDSCAWFHRDKILVELVKVPVELVNFDNVTPRDVSEYGTGWTVSPMVLVYWPVAEPKFQRHGSTEAIF